MTVTKGVAAIALVALVGACGGGGTFPDGPLRLEEMRTDSRPYYWVGEEFEGLRLTKAEPYVRGGSDLIYGTCELPSGLFVEGGCTPPLRVLNQFCANGHVAVTVYGRGDGGGRAARAAKALRPLNEAARRVGRPAIGFGPSPLC